MSVQLNKSDKRTYLGLDGTTFMVFIVALLGWTLVNIDQSFFNLNYPLIQKTLGISNTQISYLFTIIYIAGAVATFIVGPLMDNYGRRKIFVATLWLTAIGSIFSGLAWSFAAIVLFRVFCFAGSTTEMSSGQVMVAESSVAKHRNFLMGVAQIGWPLGFFIGALITTLVVPNYGWRPLFFIGIIPIVVILIMRQRVKEPERFVELKKVHEKAKELAEQERVNLGEAAQQVDTMYAINKKQAIKNPFNQLFSKDLARTTILMWLWACVYNFGAAGIISYLPMVVASYKIPLTVMWTISAWATAIAVCGYISAAWFGMKFGGKPVSVIYLILGGIAGVFLAFKATTFLSITVGYTLYYFFAIGQMGAQPGFMAESMPTRARGTGVALIGAAAWVGFVVAGFTMPVLFKSFGIAGTVFVWCAVTPFVAALFALGTKAVPPGQELEEVVV